MVSPPDADLDADEHPRANGNQRAATDGHKYADIHPDSPAHGDKHANAGTDRNEYSHAADADPNALSHHGADGFSYLYPLYPSRRDTHPWAGRAHLRCSNGPGRWGWNQRQERQKHSFLDRGGQLGAWGE